MVGALVESAIQKVMYSSGMRDTAGADVCVSQNNEVIKSFSEETLYYCTMFFSNFSEGPSQNNIIYIQYKSSGDMNLECRLTTVY